MRYRSEGKRNHYEVERDVHGVKNEVEKQRELD
jgi:hypothetical protein